MKDLAIGIDIGGTNTQFGAVDRGGNIIATDKVATQTHADIQLYFKDLYEGISNLLKETGLECKIIGVGVGAPNGNYYEGTVEDAPNLRWKGIINFVDEFKKLWNVPTVLTNDANAAAIGEMMYGGAKGMKNFIEVTLGTGLGSGFVVNGEVMYGNDGFAGELGHTIVNPYGRQCGCGRKGCLETYASATGIKRTVYKFLADNLKPSELRGVSFDNLSAKMITEAAERGDQIAMDSFEYTGKVLGQKLADAVAVTSPEAIFLFGGLAHSGDFIFKPTHKYMEENMLSIYRNKVKLLPSELQNKNAAVLGASALVWKELDKISETKIKF
ncbi:MAG TPA: ROK family protein [Balneolaceae bacterium]|nr:ROK family protein [Balneolales bacterium]HKK45097.1 ROK family protein [Balneolaceae bacterium]